MVLERADRRSLAVLSAGHLIDDMNPGAVPALLPFLVTQRHYSYAAAAGLVLASTLSSSIVQPLLGHAADRRPLPWLMPAGVFLSGLGIALTGIMPTYWLAFAAVLLCGVGVGAFHPEAARFSNFVSGPRRATSMSVFSVGGGIGFGLGPAVLTALVLAFGLGGTVLLIVPSLLMALIGLVELPRLDSFRPPRSREHVAAIIAAGSDRPAFARLTVAAMLRSIVYFAAITFSPLYFVHVFGATPAHANTVLTLVLLAGPVATLAIGRLADRLGRRTVLLTAFATTTVMLAVFLLSGELVGSAALILLGGASIATFSLVLVMAQEYMPANLGLASGIALGLPDGIGGLSAPPLGALADHLGLRASLWSAVAVGVLMVALTATLPRAGVRRGARRESPPESHQSASPARRR